MSETERVVVELTREEAAVVRILLREAGRAKAREASISGGWDKEAVKAATLAASVVEAIREAEWEADWRVEQAREDEPAPSILTELQTTPSYRLRSNRPAPPSTPKGARMGEGVDPASELTRLDGFTDWSPDDVVNDAVVEHDPVASFCLLSGGNDSTVLAHRCRDHYDELVHIDTGTAVPGVREFVERFAADLDKPLRVLEAGDAYRVLVLGGLKCRSGDETPPLGFPGPMNHTTAYTRIKERQVEALIREAKAGHPRTAKIMLLSGTRRHESARRMRTQANRYRTRGAQLWVNPLLDWTNDQMRRYREQHDLPQSEVAALLHRSGECNCGSFAAPGEREMLRDLWPEWFETTIASLEREAAEMGLVACRWGKPPPEGTRIKDGRPAEMCSDCVLRLALNPEGSQDG